MNRSGSSRIVLRRRCGSGKSEEWENGSLSLPEEKPSSWCSAKQATIIRNFLVHVNRGYLLLAYTYDHVSNLTTNNVLTSQNMVTYIHVHRFFQTTKTTIRAQSHVLASHDIGHGYQQCRKMNSCQCRPDCAPGIQSKAGRMISELVWQYKFDNGHSSSPWALYL